METENKDTQALRLLQYHAGLLAHGHVAATRAKADALAQGGRMLRELLNKVQQSADLRQIIWGGTVDLQENQL
jgi:hypothetical protein